MIFFRCNKIINLEIKSCSNLLISTFTNHFRLYEIIFLNEILEFDTILSLGTYDRMVGFVWNREGTEGILGTVASSRIGWLMGLCPTPFQPPLTTARGYQGCILPPLPTLVRNIPVRFLPTKLKMEKQGVASLYGSNLI